MRIIFNTTVYQGKMITGTSIVAAIQDWIKGMSELRDDVYSYVFLPAKTGRGNDWVYEDDIFKPTDRVSILQVPLFGESVGTTYARKWFKYPIVPTPEEGKYCYPKMLNWYYDIALDLRSHHTQQMLYMFNEDLIYEKYGVPIVAMCHDTANPAKDGHDNPYEINYQTMSFAQANRTIFYTQWEKDIFFKHNARLLLSPSVIRKLQQGEIVMAPMDFATLDDQFKKRTVFKSKDEGLTVCWGGNFYERKRPREVTSVVEKLHAKFGVKYKVCTFRAKIPDYMEKPYTEKAVNLGRDGFLDQLLDSDIMFASSQYETGCRAYYEALGTGSVLIVKKFPWNSEFFPEWYPYQGETWEEVEEIAFYVVNNLDVARKEARKLYEYVKESKVSYLNSSQNLLDAFESVIEKELYKRKPENTNTAIGKVVKDSIELLEGRGEKITLVSVNNASVEVTKNQLPILTNRFMCPKQLGRFIEAFDYKDTCRTAVPEYVKHT